MKTDGQKEVRQKGENRRIERSEVGTDGQKEVMWEQTDRKK